jgi:hypothetical protein
MDFCSLCKVRVFHVTGLVCNFDIAANNLYYALGFPDILFRDHCELEWIRDLAMEGIETNPGPSDLNGNTKRNSGTIRANIKVEERLERLSQRNDEIGKQSKVDSIKLKNKRRQKASDKAIMKQLFPVKQRINPFSIELNIISELKNIVNSLPKEMSRVISWADVIAAIRVLISDERWDAKYLAIRVLYKECKVENISVEYLLVSLIGVLSVCSITTREIPVKQNIANDPNFDAVTTFVTVMLTFIFGKKPGQGRINHVRRFRAYSSSFSWFKSFN